jgi:tRNA A37 threonylcarbamoyladenosine dehydratase
MEWLERTELLIKKEGVQQLQTAHVVVVGTGGIGSFAIEFLARAGVGKLTIIDADVVDITNINRQVPALQHTVGQPKATVMKNRVLEINPHAMVETVLEFVMPESIEQHIPASADFVLDCIDSLTPKIALIEHCISKNIPIVSCMGAGGKMDPAKVKIKPLGETKNCKLAKSVRKRIQNYRVLNKCIAVYSEELPALDSVKLTDGTNFKRSFYGTISYMPALFGLHAAGYVIRKLVTSK